MGSVACTSFSTCGILSKNEKNNMRKKQLLAQMLIQLKKFARAVRSIKAAVEPAAAPSFSGGLSKEAGPRGFGARLGNDVSEAFSTDITGIDATVGGLPDPYSPVCPPFTGNLAL